MSLQDEIAKKAGEIYRESYQMSIGELINLYRDEEMDIHPEFQRMFRWTDYQKTKLIESILLNIPIPQIFVSQCEDGTWDIVDGVQRLSTIFQFVGILKDEDGKLVPQLTLQATDTLPSLAGMRWDGDSEFVFSKEQQLTLKRARLDVTIIKKESDSTTKYELFQRLNTGGSLLSDQEVRNCLIIMTNKKLYTLLDELSKYDSFNKCVKISDRKADEQYALEMLVRLLVADQMKIEDIAAYNEIKDLLDREVIKIAENMEFDYERFANRFKSTFDLLYGAVGDDVFRKYDKGKHSGAFLSSAFQVISVGVFRNLDTIIGMDSRNEWIAQKVQQVYKEPTYLINVASGVRAIPRFKELTLWGEVYFGK